MPIAIIVAAGKGARLPAPLSKQYLSLDGVPILTRTLRVFNLSQLIDRIILVVPEADFTYCRTHILARIEFDKEVQLVTGGDRRQASVFNGLQAIEQDNAIVVIHDGVRPFLRQEHLSACINTAQNTGACILGIPAYDTVKQVRGSVEIMATLPRESIWMAQTPQVFQVDLIRKAHALAQESGYIATDDAALVEWLGETVSMVEGSRTNIKITNHEDLLIAETISKSDEFVML